MNIHEAILVWPFDKAPELYKAFLPEGDKGLWIAIIPGSFKGLPYTWLLPESSDAFEHRFENGHLLCIGIEE